MLHQIVLGSTVAGLVSAGSLMAMPQSTCGSKSADSSVAMSAMKGGILETARSAGSFNTLLTAVKAAGLEGALSGEGPFTVMAPTDEAFAKLPKETLSSLLKPENKKQLASILTYHVIAGELMAADVMRMTGATTLQGQRVSFNVSNGAVMANNAKVLTPNIECSNGVIHVIDTVILPTGDDIVVKAQSAGSFGTLLAAAKAAGLVDVLKSDGPLTVLAPTDDAFAKLPAGTVESLLKPENKAKLAGILKYHVIPSRVYASGAFAAQKLETVQGQSVVFSIRDGRLTVDGANIIATDIDASNGVIHVIDRVILPSS